MPKGHLKNLVINLFYGHLTIQVSSGKTILIVLIGKAPIINNSKIGIYKENFLVSEGVLPFIGILYGSFPAKYHDQLRNTNLCR